MTSMFRGPAQGAINFDELVVDNFAGGGGASMGIELALGRPVDIAINHDIDAIRMHEVNHPHTKHYCESVWDIDPVKVTDGRPVGLAWFSPDCKHFSKARGGTPVSKKIRGLAWVALRWAATVRPRIIILENVEEFTTWGPVRADADGNVYPCPKRKGQTFNAFKNALQRHGYVVEHRELRASEHGTPTIRKRLFLIARCDGQPISWPEPTHGPGLLPYRTAAECIDWSLPCPSIFLSKEEGRAQSVRRPLADATMRRIAAGIMRFVVNNPAPFIVNTRNGERAGQSPRVRGASEPFWTVTAQGSQHGVVMPVLAPFITEHAQAANQRNMPADSALRTQCAEVKGGHFALVSAFLAKHYTGVVGADVRDPVPTVTTIDHNALVSATLVGAGGPSYSGKPTPVDQPIGTIPTENHRAVVTSHLVKLRNNQFGQAVTEPIPTLTPGGGRVGEVRAFLVKYYSEGGQWQDLAEPMHTIPTKDRIGLVMVKGEPYQIVDIGMRMLTPRELFNAQGFPADYVIEHDGHGKAFTKTAQVARCGNSVCPPLAAALVRANMCQTMQQVAA